MPHQEPPPAWGQGGPQQPRGAWGPPQPPAPPRRDTGKIIGCSCLGALALVVLLLVAGLLIGGDGADEPERITPSRSAREATQEAGPEGDVTITGCEVNSVTKWAGAELLIDNRSGKSSDYHVEVEFVNAAGKRLGEAYASTLRLAPGQRAEVTAQGLDQISETITCRIVKVLRFAS
ncbi:FxLYD domain-containing protein [Streptomyces sp. NPDC091371]|uniref:FxLYD domain-containing protein n=1 Tax=Streptomyces sp. NPDC091371 TaxID=3155303 RepID=UPI00344547AA